MSPPYTLTYKTNTEEACEPCCILQLLKYLPTIVLLLLAAYTDCASKVAALPVRIQSREIS